MIFSIVLTYLRPIEEVNQHLDTHKAWLADNLRQGRILLAGPLAAGGGGLVLAACADEAELAAMMAQDCFIAQGVARYTAHACEPALAAAAFPVQWAPSARFI
ncbi:hypothetical protein EJD96_22385 [Herbaspirillum seropedicae]|uniref:YciI family protein n=1 Tax=Herbaspirillum seropedicae TaxID=964 RepID=UPI0011206E57|nr:YciI family protein [Herbaspirillum seropedicae]QDD66712.1 hypothetical protein EJD96_22385 [Herbaspirillum seropedicae]